MISEFKELYGEFKESALRGRYVTYSQIEKPLNKLSRKFTVDEIGKSAKGVSVPCITLGTGEIKILAWSQMHGNESTTTKAVFDLLNAFYIYRKSDWVKQILNSCTLKIIPMLNPDGAEVYTRVNAHGVDLNRDARDLLEPESRLLRSTFDDFKPDYCFNLHDQRTIFSAGDAPFPATLSFLTPSQNAERAVTSSRMDSMRIISAIVEELKNELPNQIGRFDDAYNPNCTGDSFQGRNIPTILFEAGHYQNDYLREHTRRFVAFALFAGISAIVTGKGKRGDHSAYFGIPENNKLFYDLILRNAVVEGEVKDIAIQFKEILVKEEIAFVPVVEKIGGKLQFYGHKELDCKRKNLSLPEEQQLFENLIISKILLNNEILAINYDSF